VKLTHQVHIIARSAASRHACLQALHLLMQHATCVHLSHHHWPISLDLHIVVQCVLHCTTVCRYRDGMVSST
jgi:hypothetical protein